MAEIIPVRGCVYRAKIGDEPKPWLVVSNNARNKRLDSVLAVRITTSAKPEIPSIVVLDPADEPLVGRVLCDDLTVLFRDEIMQQLGALSRTTMAKVNDGLRAALAL